MRDSSACGAEGLLLRFARFVIGQARTPKWSPRQESNLYLTLRRHPFYPLNYEEDGALYGLDGARLFA